MSCVFADPDLLSCFAEKRYCSFTIFVLLLLQIMAFSSSRRQTVYAAQLCSWIKQDRQCTYKLNIEARSRNHYCCGKAVSITYAECVFVAIGIWYVKSVPHIIL